MDIRYWREPVIGESFDFEIVDFVGTAVIEVRVGKRIVKRKECPDPPCHQVFPIAQDLRGQILTIFARDSSGATRIVELTVVGHDENQSSVAGV